MIKIGIIAGEGILPLLIGKSLISQNYSVCFFCIENYASLNDYKKYEHKEITISSFTSILKSLERFNIDQIIMAGKISRPSIKDLKFDLTTLSLIKDYLLESKGDDQLLRLISKFFSKRGYPLFEWIDICHDLFATDDFLTIKKPSKNAYKNIYKGLDIFKIIGEADLGQSMIVQNQLILGIECIEGTDELIKRCYDYKRKEDKGILLKLSKYTQHKSLDLPTIGIETVKNLNKYSYEGLCMEKNKCIILEKEKVIDFCNSKNIFLSTVNKIDNQKI